MPTDDILATGADALLAPMPTPTPTQAPAPVPVAAAPPQRPQAMPVAAPAAAQPGPTAALAAGGYVAPDPATLRSFTDPIQTRKFIYQDVLSALREMEPVKNTRHTLMLKNPEYVDPERFTRKERKRAILRGETLARRVRGTWELVDNATGQVLDSKQQVVAAVPYLSSLGTFTNRGTDYTINHQQRLLPGAFARRKSNGELEAHANIIPGKGVSHRYFLDPAKGQFKVKFQQAELPVMPLLKLLGATDGQIKDAWGKELWAANMKDNDVASVRKLKQKLLRPSEQDEEDGSAFEKMRKAFEQMEMDPEVTQNTLGKPFKNMSAEVVLAMTSKLLKISKGEAETDDRDHLAYQRFLGPEDFFSERIRRDHAGLRKQLLLKATFANNLQRIPSGALTPQLTQVLMGSGLAQSIEEINPIEVLDKQTKVSRMGEGGIPDDSAIPDESRSVQPSQLGFVDTLRTPESMRAGVDLFMARSAVKGRDGKLYTKVKNAKTGKEELITPQQLASKAIAFPGWEKDTDARIKVIKGGKMTYVKKDEVDYALPNFEDTFSPVGNLVPLKSMVKGQRVAMASRMLTQALPLIGGEAPLVRAALPGSGGSRSFDEEYADKMGAVRAKQGGKVIAADADSIRVQYDDGSKDDIELYNNHPFSRKTFIHQTGLVKPGDRFEPNQLLARSNYTDDQGATALGRNARVAYMPFHGLNFEDAYVISEGMAKKLTSEHAYQHEIEEDEKTKVGLKNYVSLFPQKYTKKHLQNMDERGVIKVGQRVAYGDPLILAVKQKDHALNKLHKQKQAGFQDATITWDHHDDGIVTDVEMTKKGPVVVVKSQAQMQVGDKLSGRYGDKGVISRIVPDDQMPKDRDGNPFEVLANPLGVITRTNPAQMAEAILGKIAAKTGKPIAVPDFEDTKDMTQWVEDLAKQHGISDIEDVVDPETGLHVFNEDPNTGEKIGVFTGNRYFMKLHHTSESKVQGRGSGAYSNDDTPAKGGETGCFVAGTQVMRWFWDDELDPASKENALPVNIEDLRPGHSVLSRDMKNKRTVIRPVTECFEYDVPESDLLELTLANGQVITVTRNHKMYRRTGEVVLAGDIVVGDDLME